MKTFLILINAANKMAKNHLALGKELEKRGNKVIYAFTDYFPFYIENLEEIKKGSKYYVFSDFYKENYNNIEFDKRYSLININKLFFSDYDRMVVHKKLTVIRDQEYNSLMINLINFFDHIYKENNVDFILYESISNSFAYTAYETGKINGAKYIGYAGCRLKGRFELYTEEYGCCERFEKVFNEQKVENIPDSWKEFIVDYLNKYEKEENVPTYHPNNKVFQWKTSLFSRYFDKEKYNLLKASILFRIKNKKDNKYSYQVGNTINLLSKGFKEQINRKIKTKTSKKYFSKPNYQEKYFLYPLHFKPEASTSVLSREYCNDISVIENIAFNLPFGSYLYVKEHFVNYGRQPSHFYERLLQIPNVKLIFCDDNIKQLIYHSQGIITLTSTVGFEALMMDKPVFVFGNVFYSSHPNCRKIQSYEDLYQKLQNLDVDKNKDINLSFLYSYIQITYPGNIYYSLDKNYNTLENFVTPFINAFNEFCSENKY